MNRSLSVEIVSDFVCPWCFIGSRRLSQAAARLESVDVTVSYRPFLLDPNTPEAGGDLRDRLREKYGVDPDSMFGRVEAAARESGIPLDFSVVRRYASTLRAHTLVRAAEAKGTQQALAEALFTVYFLEGKDIGDDEVLVTLATSLGGFSESEARSLIGDPAALREAREEALSYAGQGIDGVPFTIIAGLLAVPGAQSAEVFEMALRKALAETAARGA